MRLNYKRADLVICIRDAAQEAATKTCSIRPEKTVVVRPGIRGRMAESNPGELRRELNIGADEKVVLSVGRITKAKDVEDFGEVARVLSERGKKYRFVFAGYERDESYGRAIKEKYGQHVTFVGHRTDIANLYGDADLMVHLPHREDSPLVVIEALEFGTPYVARDLPGVSEDVENGVIGRTPQFGDIEAAADAIERMFESPGELERLGDGARERFKMFAIGDYEGRIVAHYKARLREIAKD